MKIPYILTIYLNLISINTFGQKKIVDLATCNDWERLEEIGGQSCLLSSDGNFIMYKTYSENSGMTTVVKDIKLATEKRFLSAHSECAFDNDNMFSFQLPGDSLAIFDSKKNIYTYLAGVKWYFIARAGNVDIIAYLTEQVGKRILRILNVKNGRDIILSNSDVNKYWLNKQKTAVVTTGSDGLAFADLNNLKQTLITSGTNTETVAFNSSGNGIAYIVHEAYGYELRYFDVRSAKSSILANDSSDYLKDKWKLESGDLFFGNDDGNIFFKISKIGSYYKKQQDSVITRDVTVWSYKDLYLQEQQSSIVFHRSAFTTMINIQTRRINQLESEELSLEPSGNTNRYFVLTTSVNENESYWNKERKSMFLFSAATGNKIPVIDVPYPGFQLVGISPDDRALIWFDCRDRNYYSYNIANRKIVNISGSVDGSLSTLNQRGVDAKSINKSRPYNNQYWINNGDAILVNARNDIWQLDPNGIKKPINLTNGYGNANNIRFRLVDGEQLQVGLKDKVLVWAFNNLSKQNGFWKIHIGKSTDPIKMTMSDSAFFFFPQSPIFSSNDAENPRKFKPVKSSKKNLFVVRIMTSCKQPNLYYTTDFKTFNQFTNVNSEKNHMSISTKLITWTMPDGQKAEGILHRPNNFDSTKKYPIIFNYYERRSEMLNIFRTPELSAHNINIPWYVSRGYLVFEPDFYYKRGETANSVINSIELALVELRKLYYIDQNKMGIQGHSHGGYETNILATRTKFFAAACEMAGYTNLISEYGSIRPGGFNNQMAADVDQRNIGVFPWNHPDVFIENSPVFHVSQMITPLLIIHNKEDGAVSFSQAIELYLSMRRLGKKVWMLQYDKEGHTIENSVNKLDFTVRIQQFFDHYLKDAPLPVWMSKGIPASLKGVASGLQYEHP